MSDFKRKYPKTWKRMDGVTRGYSIPIEIDLEEAKPFIIYGLTRAGKENENVGS